MDILNIFKELKKLIPKDFFSKIENPLYQLLISNKKLSSFLIFKKQIGKIIISVDEIKLLFFIGIILTKYSCFFQSLVIFYYCLRKDKSNPDAYFNIALCLKNLNRYRIAIFYFTEQKNLYGESTKVIYELAKCNQIVGNLKAAEKLFFKLFSSEPTNFSEEHKEYSTIHKYTENDPHLNILRDLRNNNSLQDKNKKFIFFALSKAYEDLKDYRQSFENLKLGNKLRKNELDYSSDIIKNQFYSIKSAFENGLNQKNFDIKEKSKLPVHIVGLPRSGTTLLEQIISSHSKVYSMAESLVFPSLIKRYFPSNDPEKFKNELININQKIVFKFREEYFKEQFKNTKKDIITDKLPFNFIFLGLINKIIPESKIIHIKRNARDTCISILKNYFIGKNINFAYDEKDIVDYFFQYQDLMKFWKNKCSDQFLEIDYEDLINNFDFSIKKVLNFVNLDYESNLEKFYQNKSSVFSLSLAQVRMPIYKTSIKNWKNFEPYLSEEFKKLP